MNDIGRQRESGAPAQFGNLNNGLLHPNSRKSTPNQPGLIGSLNVEGVEFFVDAWERETPDGKTLALRVKRRPA